MNTQQSFEQCDGQLTSQLYARKREFRPCTLIASAVRYLDMLLRLAAVLRDSSAVQARMTRQVMVERAVDHNLKVLRDGASQCCAFESVCTFQGRGVGVKPSNLGLTFPSSLAT